MKAEELNSDDLKRWADEKVREKHLPLEEMAREASRRCRGIVFFGEAAALLEEAVRPMVDRGKPQLLRVHGLSEAVAAAHDMTKAGDVVLLSPACTSFDAYDNFERRGEEFRRLVHTIGGEP